MSYLKKFIYPSCKENELLTEEEIKKQKFLLPVYKLASSWFTEDASNDE